MRYPPLVSYALQFIMLVIMSNPAAAEKLSIERLFAAPDLSGASLRTPRISPDGRLIAYLKGKDSNKDRLDLWAYDIARHEHRLLVDSAVLEPHQRALSAEEEQRRERQRTSSLSGIVEYEFSPDSRYLLVPLGGDLYVYDLHSTPEKAVRRLTNGGTGYETDAHFSPRGSYVSFIRNQNLVVYDLATSTERPITRDGGGLISYGTAEFIAQEEMDRSTGYWWSPDEKRIAYTKVDESPVAEVDRFEIYADSVKVIKQHYPAAGAKNATVQLLVASLSDAASSTPAVQVDLGKNTDTYLPRVNWFPNSANLAVQRQSRDQKTLTLLEADTTTGATAELVTEHSDTWVPLHDELTFLDHGKQFIWASSRTGFKHLYLYDLSGNLLRPLTAGEWSVVGDSDARAIRGVDEHGGLIYFMANAESPLERHLYSVSVKDPRPTPRRITTDSGWHDVTMSKDTKVFLDTFSTPDHPPSLTLRAADGKELAALIPNDITPDHPYAPYLAEHLPTEFGTLQASDGQTLYYQIIKPKELVPGKRYPVVVDVYGGPGVQRVRKAWGSNPRFPEYLAQHGYIVFTLDNRGSAARGVRFGSAIYHHMGSVEVQDQLAGVNFLKTLPHVDPKRIAVFGWSYGGYMALMCLMQAPDVFAAGIAGAPVTDWRLYDTHYTERYMGTPQENAAGYTASSVMTYASQLRGPLLIMHGMADDNVLFTHSTTLFKKLQDLDKQFDIMTYPGSKHGLLRFAATGPHGYATIKRFLDTQLGGDAAH